MNKKVINILMLTVGAAIGSAVTWKVVKTKYERIAQEEIDSVKDEYNKLMSLMKKEIEACRKITGPSQNENEGLEESEDDYYPDDDDRDFTDHEREMIDYYKLTSKYRTPEDGDNDAEYDKEGEEGESDEAPYVNGPYVISPEEFGGIPGFNVQPLDYFADGILADGWGVELDIDETVGEESLKHFGEYADDVVHVRNERTEIDYEVTRDPRTYDEAVRANPNPYYGVNEN